MKQNKRERDAFNVFATFQPNLKLFASICKGVLCSHRQIYSVWVHKMRLCWGLGKNK